MSSSAVLRQRPREGNALVAVPDSLAELAAAQHGVLCRAQLRSAGLTRHHVEAAVRAQRWQTFGRNVVVLHNAPLSAEQRLWVAVLLPSKPAALAGLSAATAAGLRGFEPDEVHIVVARNTVVAAPRWVRVHESRRFRASDVSTVWTLPSTGLARGAIDGAAWSRFPRRACAILCATVQQRLTTTDFLAEQLRAAGSVRHVAIMRDILGDIGGGGHTLAEIDFGALAVQAGLPPPRRQSLRKEPSGKVRYLDVEFTLADSTLLAVEIDGSVHLLPEMAWDDDLRQNEVVIGGTTVLRFGSMTVRLDKERVVDQLRRIRLAHEPR
ncbi:DUF559 domain-containing protein [uncultured Jatrophihabitans sp.]|uniref:DUF559 domain-containing protein n=1 Tax=uncultured Jatrophihabitans sp. TaxID=1610747 RepID=UPI0035CB4ADB